MLLLTSFQTLQNYTILNMQIQGNKYAPRRICQLITFKLKCVINTKQTLTYIRVYWIKDISIENILMVRSMSGQ